MAQWRQTVEGHLSTRLERAAAMGLDEHVEVVDLAFGRIGWVL